MLNPGFDGGWARGKCWDKTLPYEPEIKCLGSTIYTTNFFSKKKLKIATNGKPICSQFWLNLMCLAC